MSQPPCLFTDDTRIHVVNVFPHAGHTAGGNPAPIVLSAGHLSASEMQAIAATHGHESGFVLPADDPTQHDLRLRFFVPRHEMSMCGHATLGALWLLAPHLPPDTRRLSIQTLSGTVQAQLTPRPQGGTTIEISQPAAVLEELHQPGLREALLAAMGLPPDAALDLPPLNASTSRVKTLIPLRSAALLDTARPDAAAIEQLCERIGSTGLYPFACDVSQARVADARQFPKSSGYPEDAATGIAATALAFGLLHYGLVTPAAAPLRVHQGRAMGRPSEIQVRFALREGERVPHACWLGGEVVWGEGTAHD